MTEQEWLTCTDPTLMLEFLREKGSDRKLRLFAVACCRIVWHLLPNEPSRNVVLVAERFADEMATDDDLQSAVGDFTFAEVEQGYSHDLYLAALVIDAVEQLSRESDAAYNARMRGRIRLTKPEQAYQAATGTSYLVGHTTPLAHRQQQWNTQVGFIRCIFGNPFRPVSIDPDWFTPNVLTLAQAAYQHRTLPAGTLDNARLAVLADALEEAGCTNEDILTRLRGPGEHVRGCWVLDLILGKE